MAADEERVVARYTAGDNVRKIAHDLSIAVQTVYNVLARSGVEKRRDRAPEKAALLIRACQEGSVASTTARSLGLSKRTAARILRKHREQGNVLEIVKGRPLSTRPRIVENLAGLTDQELRGVPFPYPEISAEDLTREFDRLRSTNTHLDADVIRPQSLVGVKACNPFFPNRFRARAGRKRSAWDAWHDPVALRKAIQFQIDYGNPTTPRRVLRAVSLRYRTPTIFRPLVAKFIYENFCPRNGRTWDPCAGYGGRLLGALAAGVQYCGTDVDEETVSGNIKLAAAVGGTASVHLSPAESFDPPPVDLVFTSPPYFDREKYSAERSQSWLRYDELESWISGFLKPVIERSRNALAFGGFLVLNIADLRDGKETIPLIAKTTESANESGFALTKTLRMPLAAVNRSNPTEPVLIFQKQ